LGVFEVASGGGVCLWVFVELSWRARDFIRARAFPKLEADIRMAMFDHIQHHSPKYFNEHFSGSLANKISDMTTQVTSIILNLMIFIPAVCSSILILVFFSKVNPLFAMILAIWLTLHLSICFFFTSKCVKYSNIHGEVRSDLAGKIVDSLTNNFTVNLFSRFRFENMRVAVIRRLSRRKITRLSFMWRRCFCRCRCCFWSNYHFEWLFDPVLDGRQDLYGRGDSGF
jgi:ATP-binding cassette subfamily B protein